MRTTPEEVRAIIETGISADDMNAFITSASINVTSVLGTSLSEDVLKEIERWMTAHMIASTKTRISKEEGAGGAYIKYAGEFGKMLESTPYGQMVLALDTTGKYAELAKSKVKINVIPS